MVDLTPRAACEFKRLISSCGLSGDIYLRIVVDKTMSNTGEYSYALDITNYVYPDNDWYCESEGVRILVDSVSELRLNGATIDYVVMEGRPGFLFDNPNAKAVE